MLSRPIWCLAKCCEVRHQVEFWPGASAALTCRRLRNLLKRGDKMGTSTSAVAQPLDPTRTSRSVAPVHHWCDIARRVTSLPMPSDAASPEALSRPGSAAAWLPRLLSVPINELCQIDRTHEPRRLLSAQPEGSARQQSGRRATARFLLTKSKILGGDLVERDVCFSKLRKKAKERAVHASPRE